MLITARNRNDRSERNKTKLEITSIGTRELLHPRQTCVGHPAYVRAHTLRFRFGFLSFLTFFSPPRVTAADSRGVVRDPIERPDRVGETGTDRRTKK